MRKPKNILLDSKAELANKPENTISGWKILGMFIAMLFAVNALVIVALTYGAAVMNIENPWQFTTKATSTFIYWFVTSIFSLVLFVSWLGDIIHKKN
jgi:magnesium-transporting ATPase (P-type)